VYVDGIRSGGNYKSKFEEQRLTRLAAEEKITKLVGTDSDAVMEVIKNAQMYMALRETVKNQFTSEYAELRRRLVEISRRADLPEDQIFYLYPTELSSLLEKPGKTRHLPKAREAELALFRELDMPRIIRHDNFENITRKKAHEVFKKVVGTLIARGAIVDGTLINLNDGLSNHDLLNRIKEIKELGGRVILAAQQVNLTHDPLINASDGLILQNAGFVSHGAQRARELGVGALSGIDITGMVSGIKVRFDPDNKLVELLGDSL
jgi:hypothetical protein